MNQEIIQNFLKIDIDLLESEKGYQEQEKSQFHNRSLSDQKYTGFAVDELYINEVDTESDSLSTIIQFERALTDSSYYTQFSKGCFVDLFYGDERRNFQITRLDPKHEKITGVLIDTDYISYFKVRLCNFFNYYDFRNGSFILKKSFDYEPYTTMLAYLRKKLNVSTERNSLLYKVVNYLNPRRENSLSNYSLSQSGSFIRYQTTNEIQAEIVNHSLSTNDVFLIHGPVATGKTFVLAETIFHLISSGKKILVACTTNTAVDNLAISVMNAISSSDLKKAKPLRLGSIAKIDLKLKDIRLLDVVFRNRAELRNQYTNLIRSDNSNNQLSREVNELEKKMSSLINDTIRESNLIFTTFGNITNQFETYNLQKMEFDYLIVDEASQTSFSELIIPMEISKRLILAGDHQQLSVVIKSSNDKFNYGFLNPNQNQNQIQNQNQNQIQIELETYKTFFDLLIQCPSSTDICRMLQVQYRMNKKLMKFSNEHFYENQLTPHFNNQSITMMDLVRNPGERRDLYKASYGYFNTEDYEFENNRDYLVYSEYNVGEAIAVRFICEKLALDINENFKLEQIGIITPYKAQRNRIIQALKSSENWNQFKQIEVNTIDGFQGKEKEVIIVSLVKSEIDEIGFIENKKRFNVMITRAKRLMIIVGDKRGLINNDELYKEFFDQVVNEGYNVKNIFSEDELDDIKRQYDEYLNEIDGIYDY